MVDKGSLGMLVVRTPGSSRALQEAACGFVVVFCVFLRRVEERVEEESWKFGPNDEAGLDLGEHGAGANAWSSANASCRMLHCPLGN